MALTVSMFLGTKKYNMRKRPANASRQAFVPE